jgi:predicted alpha/beta hydrolase family esterase/predicted GNAT family acetyltransferase
MYPKIFTIPGLYNSGPDHWQTHWENKYGFTRIQQENWDTPVCDDWINTIEREVAMVDNADIVLIGHSLGCCTIVSWAQKYGRVIKGALLVAPSDVEAPSYPPGTTGFSPMPLFKLPFPAVIIASSNDEYVTMKRASAFADSWGAELADGGELGHINSSSALGNWPFGITTVKKIIHPHMLIQHKKIGSKGLFFVEQDGNILAEMTYTMPATDKMIIDHTEVSDELRGKNVGVQLVHTAVEYARKNGIKIIPLCPFANSVFKKKPEFGDVL